MIKRIFKQIHLWLSVPFGLIVIIICLSGAILVFERDFGHIGQAHVDNNGLTELPMDSILRSARNYLSGSNNIVGVTTYPDDQHAYKVMLAKPAMAAIWVNQYSGEVMGYYERPAIFKWASAAHRRLFGKSKAEGAFGAKSGKFVIGITAIALFVIIFSGFVIWLPKKGELKKSLSITTSKGSYRFWHDFHSVGGVISSAVIIVCILTGLNWSFEWYKKAFYGTLGTEVAKSSSHKTPAENFTAWTTAYDYIAQLNPDKEIRMYQNEAEVVVGGLGNQQATDTYSINSGNGQIISLTTYNEKKESNHIKGWIYSIHVGSWLGWFGKIIYFICVLICTTLPISGYYLWIKRLMLKKKHGTL